MCSVISQMAINRDSTTYGHKTKDSKQDEHKTNTNQTNRRMLN